jgi:cyclopropane fatty-acyl-phospholipid synthase-like methyltransferase
MNLRRAIVAQFQRPSGWLGRLVGWVMATRPSNVARNRWTVELLALMPGARILEIGCGPGLGLEACFRMTEVAAATGLDHSPVMLTQARARNAAAIAAGRLALREGGVGVLGAMSEMFDRIFAVNVIQFLAPPLRVETLRNIRARLGSNGRLAITYQPRHRKPTRDDALAFGKQIAGEMRDTGFTDIRIEELPLKPVPAVCILGTAKA